MPTPDNSTSPMLTGRHALVTGASRGIGAAIARALTDSGARVTLLGRDEDLLRAGVAEGTGAAYVTADVTDAVTVATAFATAVGEGGPIDVLVNNAGSVETKAFLRAEPAAFQRMFDVHVLGAIHATRLVLPGMIERGFGRIVNVGSTASLQGHRYISAYCVAKHALLGLTRALAVEVAKTGVTVNAVCPGYTETEMVRGSLEKTAAKTGRPYSELLGEILGDNPLGRLVRPEEVAAAVIWLCGEGAASITGQAIPIDGGETAGR